MLFIAIKFAHFDASCTCSVSNSVARLAENTAFGFATWLLLLHSFHHACRLECVQLRGLEWVEIPSAKSNGFTAAKSLHKVRSATYLPPSLPTAQAQSTPPFASSALTRRRPPHQSTYVCKQSDSKDNNVYSCRRRRCCVVVAAAVAATDV